MILDVVEIQETAAASLSIFDGGRDSRVERLRRIVGIKNVSINEYYFRDIFPGSLSCRGS